jgi:hypothetical protein
VGGPITESRTAARIHDHQLAGKPTRVCTHARIQCRAVAVELLTQSGELRELLPSVEADSTRGLAGERLGP